LADKTNRNKTIIYSNNPPNRHGPSIILRPGEGKMEQEETRPTEENNRQKQPASKKRKIKRLLLILLIVYLVTDLRLVLLIPNAIAYFAFPISVKDEQRLLQLNVFPRLTIGSDPIFVRIANKNLTDQPIPCGDDFGLDGDRSGIFHSFRFSGKLNAKESTEQLFWLHSGLGGGLSGRSSIEPGEELAKLLPLNDYVRIYRAGLYDLMFRYYYSNYDDQKIYKLGSFYVLRLPENPISKSIKYVLFSTLLHTSKDKTREMAAKNLGYNESWLSARILAGYYFKHCDNWNSTDHPYNNSLIAAGRGVIKNRNARTVRKILDGLAEKNKTDYSEQLEGYLRSHFYRLHGSDIDLAAKQKQFTEIFEYTYDGRTENQKIRLRDWMQSLARNNKDEYLYSLIEKFTKQLETETDQHKKASLQQRIEWLKNQYDEKPKRDKMLKFLNLILDKIEAAGPLPDKKSSESDYKDNA